MTAFAIRSLDLSVDEIAALRMRSLATDSDSFGEKNATAAARCHEDWEKWLAERANGRDRMIFALLSNTEYQGMCGAAIDRDDAKEGFIWGVYVAPELRGRGGACLLLEAAHGWLRDMGVERVEAEVAARNAGALKFYQNVGYVILPWQNSHRETDTETEYTLEFDLAVKRLDTNT